jgi:hypothetical protein
VPRSRAWSVLGEQHDEGQGAGRYLSAELLANTRVRIIDGEGACEPEPEEVKELQRPAEPGHQDDADIPVHLIDGRRLAWLAGSPSGVDWRTWELSVTRQWMGRRQAILPGG